MPLCLPKGSDVQCAAHAVPDELRRVLLCHLQRLVPGYVPSRAIHKRDGLLDVCRLQCFPAGGVRLRRILLLPLRAVLRLYERVELLQLHPVQRDRLILGAVAGGHLLR